MSFPVARKEVPQVVMKRSAHVALRDVLLGSCGSEVLGQTSALARSREAMTGTFNAADAAAMLPMNGYDYIILR